MSQSNIEIPIINGYYRIFFPIDGGLMTPLPSDKLLKELVNFPKVEQGYPHPSDSFNIDFYRSRDRDPDLENQLILQDRNSAVLGSIYSTENNMLVLSGMERAIDRYCIEHDIDFLSVCYRLKVIEYCQQILPGTGANPDKNSKLITAFASLKPESKGSDCRTYDFNEARMKSGETRYFDRIESSVESRRRRLPELNAACNYIENIAKTPSFDDDLHQVILDDSILTNKNNERSKKQRTNNRKKLDYTRMTQCLFCNRFHLQKPKRVLSRFCDRIECKKKNRAWEESLRRKEIDIKNTPPFGF